jgi:uncharacterized protein YecT (DUF1311 family)
VRPKNINAEVVECVEAKTKIADQRLNAAYKALQAGSKPINVNRYWLRNASGSNTEMPIAPFTEHGIGR